MKRLSFAIAAALWGSLAQASSFIDLRQAGLNEASGLSPILDGQGYWAHNDSGGNARLFRIGKDGNGQGSVRIKGAKNKDWEDMDSLRIFGEPYLLLADIGDNKAKRKSLQIYLVPEPKFGVAEVEPRLRMEFVYPDGPRDCEALAYDPQLGEIILLSKRDKPPRLYSLPLNLASTDELISANFLGTVETIPTPTQQDLEEDSKYGKHRSRVTAMDISDDGQRMLLITYKDAYIYSRNADEGWAEALKRPSQIIDIPQMPQTEGGSFDRSGQNVLAISEQRGTRIAITPIPAE